MQKLLYAATALVALGLGYAIVNYESPATATAVIDAESISSEAGSLTLEVPNMHCQYSCFPRVKDALEQSDSVESVDLVAQADDGPFDPRVVVNYRAGFDLNAARTGLAEAGYPEATIVQ